MSEQDDTGAPTRGQALTITRHTGTDPAAYSRRLWFMLCPMSLVVAP